MFYKDEKKMFGESNIRQRFSKRKKPNDQKNAIKENKQNIRKQTQKNKIKRK